MSKHILLDKLSQKAFYTVLGGIFFTSSCVFAMDDGAEGSDPDAAARIGRPAPEQADHRQLVHACGQEKEIDGLRCFVVTPTDALWNILDEATDTSGAVDALRSANALVHITSDLPDVINRATRLAPLGVRISYQQVTSPISLEDLAQLMKAPIRWLDLSNQNLEGIEQPLAEILSSNPQLESLNFSGARMRVNLFFSHYNSGNPMTRLNLNSVRFD